MTSLAVHFMSHSLDGWVQVHLIKRIEISDPQHFRIDTMLQAGFGRPWSKCDMGWWWAEIGGLNVAY